MTKRRVYRNKLYTRIDKKIIRGEGSYWYENTNGSVIRIDGHRYYYKTAITHYEKMKGKVDEL